MGGGKCLNNSHQDPQKVEDGKGESVSIGVLRVEKFSGLTSKRMRGGVRVPERDPLYYMTY